MTYVAGIIAEYNPLHYGHIYHLNKTREIAGCDAAVVALSGSFVQRGEPAILDKWTRTALALRGGADLVIEIPVLFCLGDAGRYAYGGVSLLEALGCVTNLSFGSESGDIDALKRVAGMLGSDADDYTSRIRELSKEGLSFPAARELALFETSGAFPEDAEILKHPNDSLAAEYIKILERNRRITPVAVARKGAGYNDDDPGSGYMSASGIRKIIRDGSGSARDPEIPGSSDGSFMSGLDDYAPLYTLGALEAGPVTFPGDWYGLLRYAVMSASTETIDDCPSGGEGLGNLRKKEILRCGSMEDLISAVKSRRYTRTRITRLFMQIILGITRSEYGGCDPGYIRVLGFTENGRKLLRDIRRDSAASLPVITNINKEIGSLSPDARKLLELDIHASDIYNLVTGRDVYRRSDHRMKPVMLQDAAEYLAAF